MSNQKFNYKHNYNYTNNISTSSSCNSGFFTNGSNASEYIENCKINNLKFLNSQIHNRRNSISSNAQQQIIKSSKKSASVSPMHNLFNNLTNHYYQQESNCQLKPIDRNKFPQNNLTNYDLKKYKSLQKSKKLTTSDSLSSFSSTTTTIAPVENSITNHSYEFKNKKCPIISNTKNSVSLMSNIVKEQRSKDLLQENEININQRKFVSELNLPNYLKQKNKSLNNTDVIQYLSNQNQSMNNFKKNLKPNIQLQLLNNKLNNHQQQKLSPKNVTKQFSAGILNSPTLNFQKKKNLSQQKILSKFVIISLLIIY